VKPQTYTIEFLTPCFCAGANQAYAEIRASAIRGQLRWWFRVLGGTWEQESSVFGGVHEQARASGLVVRAILLSRGPQWTPPEFGPNDPESYVWHYARVSGKQAGVGKVGPRWNGTAVLAPGTRVRIDIWQRAAIANEESQNIFQQALRCFLMLGGVGMRISRGLGAFACAEVPFDTSILDRLKERGFACEPRTTRTWTGNEIIREMGALVKGSRERNHMKAQHPSPFGSSNPRQTSAVYFRPVRSTADPAKYWLVMLQAPHERVLGRESWGDVVVGHVPSRIVKPHPRS
jgi:CRISPR-associated protein Cmr1